MNERVLSRAWVIRTLKNRAVLGEFKPIGREVIQGYYPQIISQSEFDAARAQITANSEAMQGQDMDIRRQFMKENAKHEAVLTNLTEEIDGLQTVVQSAQVRSADLSKEVAVVAVSHADSSRHLSLGDSSLIV